MFQDHARRWPWEVTKNDGIIIYNNPKKRKDAMIKTVMQIFKNPNKLLEEFEVQCHKDLVIVWKIVKSDSMTACLIMFHKKGMEI